MFTTYDTVNLIALREACLACAESVTEAEGLYGRVISWLNNWANKAQGSIMFDSVDGAFVCKQADLSLYDFSGEALVAEAFEAVMY